MTKPFDRCTNWNWVLSPSGLKSIPSMTRSPFDGVSCIYAEASLEKCLYTSAADPYWTKRCVKPPSRSESRHVGFSTDSISSVNGAVAPVVTKHSFESAVQFQAMVDVMDVKISRDSKR